MQAKLPGWGHIEYAVSRPAGGSLAIFRQHAGRERVKPKLLDLFCCAGGASAGYEAAGFEVFGVDISPQPNYPYTMRIADALSLPPAFLEAFDAIHASPPCQAYSDLAYRNGNGHEWPRLIEPIRDQLSATGKPYVIENVQGAPLQNYVVLCGTMFPGLRVIRHRLFEANFPIPVPNHPKHPLCHTLDKRKGHYGQTNEWKDFVSVNGGGNSSVAAARDAMGISWMTKREINEAIPPAYTRHIGNALMEWLHGQETKCQGTPEGILLGEPGPNRQCPTVARSGRSTSRVCASHP